MGGLRASVSFSLCRVGKKEGCVAGKTAVGKLKCMEQQKKAVVREEPFAVEQIKATFPSLSIPLGREDEAERKGIKGTDSKEEEKGLGQKRVCWAVHQENDLTFDIIFCVCPDSTSTKRTMNLARVNWLASRVSKTTPSWSIM